MHVPGRLGCMELANAMPLLKLNSLKKHLHVVCCAELLRDGCRSPNYRALSLPPSHCEMTAVDSDKLYMHIETTPAYFHDAFCA